MTRRWPVAGLLFGVIWVFVRGVEPAPEAVAGRLLAGIAVGLPVAFVFRRMYSEGIELPSTATSVPYVVLYVVAFLRDVVVANFDMAYRVLAPGMPIEPEVMYVPLRVRTDLGVTTIANSITLTPGTVTLDHDPDENALYVHIVDGRNPEEVVEPIRGWEDYALVIFDEELSPDDPPPPIRMTPEDAPPDPKTVSLSIEALDMGRGPPARRRDAGDTRERTDESPDEPWMDDDRRGGEDDGR
ncbi:MAG: Na+/H+ antiporter subunit E [Haloarculaceae archaeon]